MTFNWPHFLWLLLAMPLLVAAYLWLLRRRGKPGLHYSSLHVVRAAAGRSWRHHVPPALLLGALAILCFSAARPVASIAMPWSRSTVILAIDVSLSMRVTDVKPTRIAAAQEAAKLFLRELPKEIEVGLVTFAGSSQVVQRATLDRATLAGAIDGLQLQRGTAIGNAIAVSLSELFPDHGIDVGEMTFGGRRAARALGEKPKAAAKPITPVAPGTYESAAIILLSDGRRTTGIDTLEAAKMAADRGVRIYVVGLGTPNGTASFGEFGSIYLQLDEETLREVARVTAGEYHHAGTAEMLNTVYGKLGSRVQVHKREVELTAFLALGAALLATLAAVLSLVWFRRVA